MEGNKFTSFFNNYAGWIVGIIIGIIIFVCDFLHRFFTLVLFILICGVIGNYVQRNKAKVKEVLKNLIDKM